MTNTLTRQQQGIIFAGLATLMLATRYHHFGTALHMPDASLAIFFIAGFYLGRPLYFALLAVEAAAIDFVAINFSGASTLCITAAYAFLAVSYLVAWAGGRWSRNRHELNAAFAVRLALTAFATTSLGFLIANGSFYWLSGRIADTSLAGYWSHMTAYFPFFVGVACAYIAAVAVAHGTLAFLASRQRPQSAV